MRTSLENIAFVENYLLGKLSPKASEEARKIIEASPELTELLEAQRSIVQAARRQALRNEILQITTAPPSIFSRFKYRFLGGIGLLLIGIVGLFILNRNATSAENANTVSFADQVAQNKNDVVPWIPFEIQTFPIDAQLGATIVGMQGTLIILPKDALLDVDGNLIHGKVNAELIEALKWEDMIAYNLTTTSDGKALSSGGMLRIRYMQNGKEVFVNPEKPMHIEVPTDEYNPEMMTWEGEVNNGDLNWKNPQAIETFLTKVNLSDLNFVPTEFETTVASILPYKNHTRLTNKLVDSLYYAMGKKHPMMPKENSLDYVHLDCFFNIPQGTGFRGIYPENQDRALMKGKNSVTGQIVDEEGTPIAGMNVVLRMDGGYLEHEQIITTDENGKFTFNRFYPGVVSIYASSISDDNSEIIWKYCLATTFQCPKTSLNYTLKEPLVATHSRMYNPNFSGPKPKNGGCFIDPLAIKTIKSGSYQNTFVATKEFEDRLQAMHTMENGEIVLETYLKNLSLDLWKCDQLAAKLLTGNEKAIFQAFADQRLTKVKNDGINQEALNRYYSEQRRAYRTENRNHIMSLQKKSMGELASMRESLNKNVNDSDKLAAQMADERKPRKKSMRQSSTAPMRSSNQFSYKLSWVSSAWINLDCYLPLLGPNPWITSISTSKTDGDMKVLQCLRESKTIIALAKVDGGYSAKFPRKTDPEDTYCLGILSKEGQLWFDSYTYSPASTRSVALNLKPVSQDEFYLRVCSLAPESSLLASQMKAEAAVLVMHERVKAKNADLINKLQHANDAISAEILIYNQLFDVLDRCPNSTVQ